MVDKVTPYYNLQTKVPGEAPGDLLMKYRDQLDALVELHKYLSPFAGPVDMKARSENLALLGRRFAADEAPGRTEITKVALANMLDKRLDAYKKLAESAPDGKNPQETTQWKMKVAHQIAGCEDDYRQLSVTKAMAQVMVDMKVAIATKPKVAPEVAPERAKGPRM